MVKIKELEIESEILHSMYSKAELNAVVLKFLEYIENRFTEQKELVGASLEDLFNPPEVRDVAIIDDGVGLDTTGMPDEDDDDDD